MLLQKYKESKMVERKDVFLYVKEVPSSEGGGGLRSLTVVTSKHLYYKLPSSLNTVRLRFHVNASTSLP